MCARGGELVTANKSTVMTKPPLDPIVVEKGQGDGGLPDPASTDESDWSKFLGEVDYLLDQLVASESPRWQRWRFPGYARFRCEMIRSSVA